LSTSPIAPGAANSSPSPPDLAGASQNLHKSTPDKRLPVVDKSKVDPETLKAAEGFEGMFLDYMMRIMRQTVPKNEMDLENGATEIYRGMLDSEYAQKAVHAGGVGLADQIVAYLEAQRYNLPRGSPPGLAPQDAASQAKAQSEHQEVRKGGTDAGRADGQ
jgi:Rod binding domain-containing protein